MRRGLAILLVVLGVSSGGAFGAIFLEVGRLAPFDQEEYVYGESASMDDDVLVVGGRGFKSGYTEVAGTAYVYERGQGGVGNWGLVKKLLNEDELISFGSQISVSGDWVAVGAPWASLGAGEVFVYERNRSGHGAWEALQRIPAIDPAGKFGAALELDGDTLVVGAPELAVDSGAFYIFERNVDTGDFVLVRQYAGTRGDDFGKSVSVNGDWIVVGSGGGVDGRVSLYGRNQDGVGQWGYVRNLAPAVPGGTRFFGDSVSIRGETVVVGAYRAFHILERHFPEANSWGEQRKFGSSLSEWMAGQRVFTGDALALTVARASGEFSVKLLRRNRGGPDQWGEVKEFLPGFEGSSTYGSALGMSEERVAVCDLNADSAGALGDASGLVQIYERIEAEGEGDAGDEEWEEVRRQKASIAAPFQEFGHGVSLSEDLAVVGAPNYTGDFGGTTKPGAVHYYKRDRGGADNWGLLGHLRGTGMSDYGDQFGISVDLSMQAFPDPDYMVVGAPRDDETGIPIGAVYVFARLRDNDGFTMQTKIMVEDAQPFEQWGRSVGMSGVTVVIGAHLHSVAGSREGAVYLFEKGPYNPWLLLQKVQSEDIAAGDEFGWAVDIDGDLAVASAPYHGIGGAVYVFERHQGGSNQWGQVAKLASNDGDPVGWSVAIEGETVVTGAMGGNGGRGAAYVFERDWGGSNQWGQVKKLTAMVGLPGDLFGTSVSLSGDNLVVGAPGGGAGTNWFGAIHLYGRDEGGVNNWGEVEKITAPGGHFGDQFGHAVEVDRETILAGAPFDDDAGTDSGFAHVFEEVSTSVTRSEGGMTLSWKPAKGGLVLEMREDFSGADWVLAPSGGTNPVTVPFDGAARYFRARRAVD